MDKVSKRYVAVAATALIVVVSFIGCGQSPAREDAVEVADNAVYQDKGLKPLAAEQADKGLLPLAYSGGSKSGHVFSTWKGNVACVDSIGAAWLILRFVDEEAQFKFYERDSVDMEGTLFSVPQAELRVAKNLTTFDAVLSKYSLDAPELTRLATIVRDIDVNKWGDKATDEAKGLESMIRGAIKMADGDDEKIIEAGLVLFDCLYADMKSQT